MEWIKKHGVILAGVGLVIALVYYFLEIAPGQNAANAANTAAAQNNAALQQQLQQEQEEQALSQLTGGGTEGSLAAGSQASTPATISTVAPTAASLSSPVSLATSDTGTSASSTGTLTLSQLGMYTPAQAAELEAEYGPATAASTPAQNASNQVLTSDPPVTSPPTGSSPYGTGTLIAPVASITRSGSAAISPPAATPQPVVTPVASLPVSTRTGVRT